MLRRARTSLWRAAPVALATFSGTVLSLGSSGSECAPKRKAPAAAAKPTKKAGPALSALEASLQPNKTYNVEKLLASRLSGGKKEYLVRWEGYSDKHDTWEPITNLSNLVAEMAAFDLAKEQANQAQLQELQKQKRARQRARQVASLVPIRPTRRTRKAKRKSR